MKFTNPFKKKAARAINCPSAVELHASAAAFVEAVIRDATEYEARLIELAVKTGALSLTIDISPVPNISIRIDPGQPVTLQINPDLSLPS